MAGEIASQLSIRNVPYRYTPIFIGARKRTTVRTERKGYDRLLISGEREGLFSTLDVPYSDRILLAGLGFQRAARL